MVEVEAEPLKKWFYFGMFRGARGWGRPKHIFAATREQAVKQAEDYAVERGHTTFKVEGPK